MLNSNNQPIGTVRYDELLSTIRALIKARPDTYEALELLATVYDLDKLLEPPSQLRVPVMVIEQPKQLTGRK